VAIFRALKLGDLLCATPAFRAIRRAWPRAHVILIGLPWARVLIRRYPRYLDGFCEFPGYPGLPEQAPDIRRFGAFLRRAHRARFDLALQLHGSGIITNHIVMLLGAATAAGFCAPDAYCPDPSRFPPYPQAGPEVVRLLRLLDAIGVPSAGTQLDFPIYPTDRRAARRAAGSDLVAGTYVCVHPGGYSAARWPPERFAAVADALAGKGLRIVLTGQDAERRVTQQVARAMRAPARDTAGRTNLGALGALVADARLLVCNDTGVSHLAAALRVPSVVVYTTSDPGRWAPLDRTLHRTALPDDGPSEAGPDVGNVTGHAEALLSRRTAANVRAAV
jgi:ADP-heptose:LPS heptosyltransferase